jgi:hypothetical protein
MMGVTTIHNTPAVMPKKIASGAGTASRCNTALTTIAVVNATTAYTIQNIISMETL